MNLRLRFTYEPASACQHGHDWETIGVIDTEPIDGTKYEVLLIECLECGEEQTRLGNEIEDEEEIPE